MTSGARGERTGTGEFAGFSAEELQALRARGLLVFADRLLFEAQPPVTGDVLERIQARLSGPIPQAVIDLWRVCFGASLDYDLSVDFGGGRVHPVSFTELFYPGSRGYKDLWGWIDHEARLAKDAAEERDETWSGRIDYLPIGGFEYPCRIYVDVRSETHGQVVAWMQGLPATWVGRLHEDAVAGAPGDLRTFFGRLHFEQDPRVTDAGDGEHGGRIKEHLDELALPDELRQKVDAFLLRDFRPPASAPT
jgi:hypothetical protein